MRHCERPEEDSSFFSSLTYVGMSNSVKNVNLVADLDIQFVYTSPFLRCIQTSLPIAWRYKCVFKQEYSLYEWDHAENTKHELNIWSDDMCKYFGISPINILKSYHNPVLIVDETRNDFNDRIDTFVQYVRQMHPSSNVLICTHLSCINKMQGRPLDFAVPPGSIEQLEDAVHQ